MEYYLNLLHKYRVLEDKGRFLKLMHIDDKEYKGLKLPMSFVKNGIVTIQIIPKKWEEEKQEEIKEARRDALRKERLVKDVEKEDKNKM